MAAAVYNFILEQGTDFSLPIVIKNDDGSPFSLSGYTARMQVRQFVTDTTTIDDLTTANGKLTIASFVDPDDGLTYWKITIIFSSTTTSAFTFNTGVYDLEIVSSGGSVTRLIQGKITLSKEVTR